MRFDIKEVSGIGEYEVARLASDKFARLYLAPNDKVFVVVRGATANGNVRTIEVRTDDNLGRVLMERYESVMESRYFGRGGIEIVMSGQIPQDEVYDLVRLSYNLTIK